MEKGAVRRTKPIMRRIRARGSRYVCLSCRSILRGKDTVHSYVGKESRNCPYCGKPVLNEADTRARVFVRKLEREAGNAR